MKEKFTLKNEEIASNIARLQKLAKEHGLDAFYLSSYDPYMSEYVPLQECHRYYVTGFSGSVGESLVLASGKSIVFVDGRYHEQADLECDSKVVEVYKCSFGEGLETAVLKKLKDLNLKKIGVESQRTSLSFGKQLEENCVVSEFSTGMLQNILNLSHYPVDKSVYLVSDSLVGETVASKLNRILNEDEAFYLSALDQVAWFSNARGFHFPNQSTFAAKALATQKTLYLFVDPKIHFEASNEDLISRGIQLIKVSESQFQLSVQEIASQLKTKKVFYTPDSLNLNDYQLLKRSFGIEKLEIRPKGLIPYMADKNPTEISTMLNDFDCSDRAIFKTIRWVKNKVFKGEVFSELDFYHQTNAHYAEVGVRSQSFKTISAVGTNSSIIHFSKPSEKIQVEKNQLMLLDTGGLYESGYATDCTRSFLSGGVASEKQKEIYTLVLKGLLHAMNAVFPVGTWGAQIDALARAPMLAHGYNYAHGTGHGVGINVHEGEFRIAPKSTIPLMENHVGSIEPGIYLPGFGGVRLENVVVVEKHKQFEGMLCFRSLVYVGFDHELIDTNLMTSQEIKWLNDYEAECAKRGRSFK